MLRYGAALLRRSTAIVRRFTAIARYLYDDATTPKDLRLASDHSRWLSINAAARFGVPPNDEQAGGSPFPKRGCADAQMALRVGDPASGALSVLAPSRISVRSWLIMRRLDV